MPHDLSGLTIDDVSTNISAVLSALTLGALALTGFFRARAARLKRRRLEGQAEAAQRALAPATSGTVAIPNTAELERAVREADLAVREAALEEWGGWLPAGLGFIGMVFLLIMWLVF